MMEPLACNPDNERIKRLYFDWCRNAEGLSPTTIGHSGRAIRSFETFTGHQNFKAFDDRQAIAYREHLANDPSLTTGKLLALATQNSTLTLVRSFLKWLSDQPGYRQAILIRNVGYLALSRRERALISQRTIPKPFPTCDQIIHCLRVLPCASDIEKRDRAIIAFLLLTCARVGSVQTVKLRHIDLANNRAIFDARSMATKNSKSFSVWFFPVEQLAREILADWVDHLQTNLGWEDDDPLFPSTAQVVGQNLQFTTVGLERRPWLSPNPIRVILRKRLAEAGLPYFHPHGFRDTLTRLGELRCRTAEEFKAWSQNMAHESVLTTFRSYGEVAPSRQAEIIAGLTAPAQNASYDDELQKDLQSLLSRLEQRTTRPRG